MVRIKGHGQCDDTIQIYCDATDVCATELGIFFSYNEYNMDLAPAHECLKAKCAYLWSVCDSANPGYDQECDGGESVAVTGAQPCRMRQ